MVGLGGLSTFLKCSTQHESCSSLRGYIFPFLSFTGAILLPLIPVNFQTITYCNLVSFLLSASHVLPHLYSKHSFFKMQQLILTLWSNDCYFPSDSAFLFIDFAWFLGCFAIVCSLINCKILLYPAFFLCSSSSSGVFFSSVFSDPPCLRCL